MTYDERMKARAERKKYIGQLVSLGYDPLNGTKKNRSCVKMKTKAPNKSAQEFNHQRPRGLVKTNAYSLA